MLDTVLLIALGFFGALFLVLLAAPAVARRISDLTWRQAERVLPQSFEEIAAARDHLRGAHAMDIRNLEKACDALNDRLSEARARVTGLEDRIAAHVAERDAAAAERDAAIAAGDRLGASLATAENEIAMLRSEAADVTLRLESALDEARLAAAETNRARRAAADSEAAEQKAVRAAAQARADADMMKLRATTAEAELRMAKAEIKRHESEGRHIRKRLDVLEAKLHRQIAELADAEERARSRDAEIKRMVRQNVPAKPQRADIAPVRAASAVSAVATDRTDPASGIPAMAEALLAALPGSGARQREALTDSMMDIAAAVVAEAAAQAPAHSPLNAALSPQDEASRLARAINRRRAGR